jgi:hypothetical protein
MNCWSCQKEIPNNAEFCSHCEAEVIAEPSTKEQAAAADVLGAMSSDLISELRDAFDKSDSGEDFVNRIMVGDCPQCGGSKTGDCENDPEIDDPCVGRCYGCGQLWCLDCGEFFKDAQSTEHDCPAWEGMDFDDDDVDELN